MPHWFRNTANTLRIVRVPCKNRHFFFSLVLRGENKLVNSIDPMHAFRMKEKSNVRQKVNCTRLTTLCVINVACNSFRIEQHLQPCLQFWRQKKKKTKWNTKRLRWEDNFEVKRMFMRGQFAKNKETHFPTICCFYHLPFHMHRTKNGWHIRHEMGIYQWKETFTQTSPLSPVVCIVRVAVCECERVDVWPQYEQAFLEYTELKHAYWFFLSQPTYTVKNFSTS